MKKLPILATIIGTGLGSGFWPWGPGTAGSILGVIVWYVLSMFFAGWPLIGITFALVVLFTVIGTWATKQLMPFWGNDPRRVVVDEIVGVWIPLLAVAAQDILYAAIALVLFRVFDIWKPLGIRALDRRIGAFYVMADDLLAGLYSLVIVLLLQWLI